MRCDFFSRPPRVSRQAIEQLFEAARDPLLVVDLPSLISMKRTQRAKDYAVIGELAKRLPPAQELLVTTDPDRIMLLADEYGAGVSRSAVVAARARDRDGVVVALAREQRTDRARLDAYSSAAERYLEAFARLTSDQRRLPTAHAEVVALAERLLPRAVNLPENLDDVTQ